MKRDAEAACYRAIMRSLALATCTMLVGIGIGCGAATPTPVPAAASTSASASTATSALEPGKGLVVSPKCSDVHDGVRIDIDDTGAVVMVQVTNTTPEILSVSGASKRASAGYGGLDQGEHVSFQMKKGDNWYVVAARTKDVFAGADFKAGAPTSCGDELRVLETETRKRLGFSPKPVD